MATSPLHALHPPEQSPVLENLLEGWGDPWRLTVLLLALALVTLLAWATLRRRDARWPLRRLLGRAVTDPGPVGIFLRGMFVPAAEFFSRAPEYPPGPSGGVTVHKWTGIPEVFDAAEVRALGDVLSLLIAANPDVDFVFRSVEKERRLWDQNAVAIGTHFTSQQILEGCEPRLVAFRNPDAFRSLVSQEVFETRGGTDFGLIYTGRRAATHHTFWVIMGLSSQATEATARFLRTHAEAIGKLTGGSAFAAILAVDPARGGATLRSLQPRPVWWRRLLHRKILRELAARPSAEAGGKPA
jgi:hypothetical protein